MKNGEYSIEVLDIIEGRMCAVEVYKGTKYHGSGTMRPVEYEGEDGETVRTILGVNMSQLPGCDFDALWDQLMTEIREHVEVTA